MTRNRIGEREDCCWPGCSRPRFNASDAPPVCGIHLVTCASYISESMADLVDPLRQDRAGLAPDDTAPAGSIVYYIRLGDHIKIGTTTSLTRRLREFYLDDAAVLATEPGGTGTERQRHYEFASERVYKNRELLNPSRRLLAHIEALAS